MNAKKKALHHIKKAEHLLKRGETDTELEDLETGEPVQPTNQPSTASSILDNDDAWLAFSIIIVMILYAVWQFT